VTQRIEWCPAQRTGRTPGGHDLRGAHHERPRRRGGHPHAEQIGPVVVLVIVVVGVDRLAVLVLRAGLDQHPLRTAIPAERQRTGPERLIERLVERAAVRRPLVGRRGGGFGFGQLDDAAYVELVEQRAEALGQHRDLDLLEHDRYDPAALASLEEERPIARLADRAGDEAVRRIEDVSAAGHPRDSIPNRQEGRPGRRVLVDVDRHAVPASRPVGRRPGRDLLLERTRAIGRPDR
jgi:hypothetical protein